MSVMNRVGYVDLAPGIGIACGSLGEQHKGGAAALAVPQPPPQSRHGWKAPAILLQQEKFEHRTIAYMKAEGKSNVEIAEITGFSATAIGYIVKQPWMEPTILSIIASKGGDAVETFLAEQVMPSLERLALERDNEIGR